MWGSDNQESTDSTKTETTGSELLKPVKVLNDLEHKFDDLYNNIVGSLNSYNLYSSKLQTIEVQEISKQLQSKKEEVTVPDEESQIQKDIKQLLNAGSNAVLNDISEVSVPHERKKRYQFYDEIPNVSYIAYRMLKVYLDNILIKNVQTKQFLNITANQNNISFLQSIDNDIGKHYENFLKTSSVYFDLQKKLKNKIIPDMLKYGNTFIEILNLQKVKELSTHRELITESYIDPASTSEDLGYCIYESVGFDKHEETREFDKDLTPTEQFAALLNEKAKFESIEESMFFSDVTQENSEYKFDDINNLDFTSIKDIYLKNINPNQVIIVENDSILYGYLIVEELDKQKQGSEIDVFKRFTQQETSTGNSNEEDLRLQIIDNMTKGVINKMNDTIQATGTQLKDLDLTDSVESSIKIILYHKIKEQARLKFRFIMPNRLINFSTNIDKFGPYGTSIFDPIIQPVKMYTLALMSSIVSRLSRASVVRKWTIEAGNRKNHAEIIEKVKKDINNKSISFDDLSDVKNIGKVVTDFRDLATIQVNGQRFIDMEVMPMGDRALPMNDLSDLRNELIAATGIPSVYLNIGDQVDLRETLVNLNTSFATTVSAYQGNIDDALSKLMNSIFGIVLENNGYQVNDFLLSNYYAFSLNPPLVLTVQANEALVSSVTNIIGMLKSAEIIVDPMEMLKLYIPTSNWDELSKTGENFIKQQAKEQLMQPQDQQGGGY